MRWRARELHGPRSTCHPTCRATQADEFNGQMNPVGGLVYYISPPDSLADAAANPVHTLFYVAFMLGSEWLGCMEGRGLCAQPFRVRHASAR